MFELRITEIPSNLVIRTGEYEPGNGTNYKAIAIPWPSYANYNRLGSVDTGWLVINCNDCRAYLFQEKGYLSDRYVQEKLGEGQGDYPYFGDLIRKLIERE